MVQIAESVRRLASLVGVATSFTILTKDQLGRTRAYSIRDVGVLSSDKFEFDATDSETISRTYTPLTNDQLEARSASEIPPTDHVIRNPVSVAVSGFITPTLSISPVGVPVAALNAVSSLTGQRRDLQQYEALKALADKRELVTVVMREEFVDNMLILGLTRTKVPTTGRKIPIQIAFGEQRIALPSFFVPSRLGAVLAGGGVGSGGPQRGKPFSSARLPPP